MSGYPTHLCSLSAFGLEAAPTGMLVMQAEMRPRLSEKLLMKKNQRMKSVCKLKERPADDLVSTADDDLARRRAEITFAIASSSAEGMMPSS